MLQQLPKRVKKRTKESPAKSFCEFFAGIGLVREGLSPSGWECIYANDIAEKKEEIYRARFGQEKHFHLEDIGRTNEIVMRIEGKPFLCTASFPCIDLSLAGHWRGFEGEHSSTLFGFTDVIQALKTRKPKLIVVENVVGFLTSHDGKDFERAVQVLADLGYWLDSFVVDAKYFVPQSRPRVFIIGLHTSVKSPVLTRKKSDGFDDRWRQIVHSSGELRPQKLLRLMDSIELSTGWAAAHLSTPRLKRKSLANLIDIDAKQEWWDSAEVTKHYKMMSQRHKILVDALMREKKTAVGTIYRRKRHDKTMAEVRFDGVAGCLRTPRGGSARQIVIVIDKGELKIRWMSPREYARLMGVDDFPLVGGRNQQLLGFGDAVCVPVIRWIDENVLTPIYESLKS